MDLHVKGKVAVVTRPQPLAWTSRPARSGIHEQPLAIQNDLEIILDCSIQNYYARSREPS
ncbi:hypothetical protein [Streptomyces sp. NPDC005181]|uniref:hypothetical protein n=1 Tax=Streptomyces sp. NPDC005181 TaxID=3156869 RepID=UPI0033B6131C